MHNKYEGQNAAGQLADNSNTYRGPWDYTDAWIDKSIEDGRLEYRDAWYDYISEFE